MVPHDETRRAAGRQLSRLRRERGLSQEQLAEQLGLSSKGSVSAIETGAEPASVELALAIQLWSNGIVLAAALRPDRAHLIPIGPQPAPTPAEAA